MLRSSLLFVLLLLLSLQLFGEYQDNSKSEALQKSITYLQKEQMRLENYILSLSEQKTNYDKQIQDLKDELESTKKEDRKHIEDLNNQLIIYQEIQMNLETQLMELKKQVDALKKQLNQLYLQLAIEIALAFLVGLFAGYIVNNLTNRT